jgi:1-aminocyclopropane-1-carboxylate deaminase
VIAYNPPPVQELKGSFLDRAGVRVLIRREDLNHPHVSGNKWWKLKYNLGDAVQLGYRRVLTFGGTYSNHLYATAAAAHELGLDSVGIVRGEESRPLNSILSFARQQQMALHFISREDYRKKTDAGFLKSLVRTFGEVYIIPEGGTNSRAVKGCAEWGQELSAMDFDRVCLPVGTGGTISGIVQGLRGQRNVAGYAVLKGGDFLRDEVRKITHQYGGRNFSNWEIVTRYHFGGYAKSTPELLQFIGAFENEYRIPLDPVYTGKMMYGIWDQLKRNEIPRGTTLLVLHTGGIH